MKTESLPEGIYAAALTPLHPDLSCDSEKLANHCSDLLKRGCQGVVLFGTTGEGASFSVGERIEALKKVPAQGLDPKKVILANGSASIPDTSALALAALEEGCTTLLIAPPSFYKNVNDEGVIAYYRTIIQKIGSPKLRILLYHIPQYSGVPITLPIIRTLLREFPETIIGLKESEGNLPFSKAILKEFPGLQLFVGNEKQIIETVHLGGAGSICGIANLYPELIVSLFHQGKKGIGPNPPEFEEIYLSLKKSPFIPIAKAMLHWPAVRPPLVSSIF